MGQAAVAAHSGPRPDRQRAGHGPTADWPEAAARCGWTVAAVLCLMVSLAASAAAELELSRLRVSKNRHFLIPADG